MKPRAEGGVVDSALNVYGVRRLKVVDMSIAPSNAKHALSLPSPYNLRPLVLLLPV
ncbi:hypothetical protein GGX14DRAFT_578097 [Mycena pura]|uniref:Glucose-methanol-choline oxidoreductase C-terminal domain-containing protein n=1 Tax=Mycena pura TaxID=153505 RepID=A0AAD6UTM1_9AGAR|nr:hypothetical protein GGX14DRAFT_578097 [Mycena pura]